MKKDLKSEGERFCQKNVMPAFYDITNPSFLN
jgi:hypothetical protein